MDSNLVVLPILRLDVDDVRGEVSQHRRSMMDILITIGVIVYVVFMLGSSGAKDNDIDRTVPEPPDDWGG